MQKDGKTQFLLAGLVIAQQETQKNLQIKLSDQFLTDEQIQKHREAVLDSNSYIFSMSMEFKPKYYGQILDDIMGLFTWKKN